MGRPRASRRERLRQKRFRDRNAPSRSVTQCNDGNAGSREIAHQAQIREIRVPPPPPPAEQPEGSGKRRPAPKPDGVSQEVWDDWCAHRRKKSSTVTATVVKGAAKEAEKAGMNLEAFLTAWVTNGTQGFKADWIYRDALGGQRKAGGPPPSLVNGRRIVHPERMPIPYDSPTGDCQCESCIKARGKPV